MTHFPELKYLYFFFVWVSFSLYENEKMHLKILLKDTRKSNFKIYNLEKNLGQIVKNYNLYKWEISNHWVEIITDFYSSHFVFLQSHWKNTNN